MHHKASIAAEVTPYVREKGAGRFRQDGQLVAHLRLRECAAAQREFHQVGAVGLGAMGGVGVVARRDGLEGECDTEPEWRKTRRTRSAGRFG